MVGIRLSRSAPRQAAVLVRIFAFLVAGVSAILVPADLAAAAAGHVAPGTAFAIAGALSALTLATIAVARNFDPLRR